MIPSLGNQNLFYSLQEMIEEDEQDLEDLEKNPPKRQFCSPISDDERVVWTPDRRSCESDLVHRIYLYCDERQFFSEISPSEDPLIQKLYHSCFKKIPSNFSLVKEEVSGIISLMFKKHHEIEREFEEMRSDFSHHFSYSSFFIESIAAHLPKNKNST